ncbi:DNA-binding response regulator [Streptomyces hygroscopicus subsp. hygroscopicus]|uniref:response regulator n=1 Tax=Streptomyces sp. KHY 26 TaxID=3097359 RepID=UPI0024A260F6|nr:response regulator transcription factor [Streptomyces hygroscopicus]GLX47276.1 DNA-binding response regulator [Streptomyces hygroscopicus subsp. hygroscopicus]
MTTELTRGPLSDARTRLVVVDDHNLFRTGLVSLLTSVPTFVVEAEGSTGAEAVVLCRLLHPDVLILDIEVPGSDPHEMLIDIHKDSPDTKVIILSMHDDGARIRELIADGVSGFLHKSVDYPALRTAIDSVLMNSNQLIIHLPQRSLFADDRAGSKPSGLMSTRELEVLSILAEGMSNAELARRLFISVSTVKRHLTNIYRKLGAVSRVDALRRAEAAGMLPGRPVDDRSPTSGSPPRPRPVRSRPYDRWHETS